MLKRARKPAPSKGRFSPFEDFSDVFAEAVHGLMSGWKVVQVVAKVDGKHIGAPEE